MLKTTGFLLLSIIFYMDWLRWSSEKQGLAIWEAIFVRQVLHFVSAVGTCQ